MPIIFGFRRRQAILATLGLACRNGHVAAHRIVKLTRWFTLFFIPVIPLGSKYLSTCIQCGLTLQLPKEEALALAGQGAAAAPPAPSDPVNPPLPMAAPAPAPVMPPAGWYPDPAGGAARRFWDGAAWTDSLEQL
jgi:hypothetical protein